MIIFKSALLYILICLNYKAILMILVDQTQYLQNVYYRPRISIFIPKIGIFEFE